VTLVLIYRRRSDDSANAIRFEWRYAAVFHANCVVIRGTSKSAGMNLVTSVPISGPRDSELTVAKAFKRTCPDEPMAEGYLRDGRKELAFGG
jgi:hypothetical protein